MIIFPVEFKALKGFHGYFWNTTEERLYSIKIGGVLRKLSLRQPNRWTRIPFPFYELYRNGNRRYVSVHEIKARLLQDYTVEVERPTLNRYEIVGGITY